MKLRYFLMLLITIFCSTPFAQVKDSLNNTDKKGLKQGHWIKKYPSGHVQYDGYFKDDKPFGAFKRYFENDTLHSILIFTDNGREAFASIYHQNGLLASKGRFINQLKEGKWQFFSSAKEGYLICEEEYKSNSRNGASVKYYPDSSLAESVRYENDIRHGEWIQYFPNGTICLKATYIFGKLHGPYTVFFDNGNPEFAGQYKEDLRDGIWKVYKPDGSLKYNIEYVGGIARNSEKFKKESDYLDLLEKNKGKIADPEKTGTLWQQP